MLDADKRAVLFEHVAGEYEANALVLAPESKEVPITGWAATKPHVLSSSEIKQIYDDYEDLGVSFIRLAIRTRPGSPRIFLVNSAHKIKNIHKKPQFSEFGLGVIKKTAMNYPTRTEEFLDKALLKIEELKNDTRFSELTSSIISTAVVNFPSNPEARLLTIKNNFEFLISNPAYAVFNRGIIYQIATRTSSVEKAKVFIEKAIKRYNEFSEIDEYRELGQGLILRAVIDNSTNPKGFLDRVIINYDKFRKDKRYKKMGNWAIKELIAENSLHPAKALDQAISKIAELRHSSRFRAFGNHAITYAVIKHKSNPKKFLNEAIERYTQLKANDAYKHLPDQTIKHASLSYPTNPTAYLDGVVEKAKKTAANTKYAALSKAAIINAAARFKNPDDYLSILLSRSKPSIFERLSADPEYEFIGNARLSNIVFSSNNQKTMQRKLEAHKEAFSKLCQQYNDLDRYVVIYAYQNSNDPKVLLAKSREVYKKYQNHHSIQTLGQSFLLVAATHRLKRADEFLEKSLEAYGKASFNFPLLGLRAIKLAILENPETTMDTLASIENEISRRLGNTNYAEKSREEIRNEVVQMFLSGILQPQRRRKLAA